MMENPLIVPNKGTPNVIQLVLDSVTSVHTKRAYSRALNDFIAWYEASGRPGLNKAVVQRYAAQLREEGKGPGTINLRLSAIRKLAQEAADNMAIPETIANGIKRVKGIRQEGTRTGNWLTRDQAQAMLEAPNPRTLKGKRDRALFAVLIGCGLRRQEAANLTLEHIQQREGRWVIVDIIGKRNKVRSVPMPNWAKAAIDTWTQAAFITQGLVFRAVNKGGRLGEPMTDQAIFNVVKGYATGLCVQIAPHDLRRTFAKLAYKGGAAIEQIQLSLGHGSLKTTEKYLGVEQDLTDAPCDHLGLRLNNGLQA
jgi:site-specific recombinase XerD